MSNALKLAIAYSGKQGTTNSRIAVALYDHGSIVCRASGAAVLRNVCSGSVFSNLLDDRVAFRPTKFPGLLVALSPRS